MGNFCKIFAKGSFLLNHFLELELTNPRFPEIRKLTILPSIHVTNCINSLIAQKKKQQKR
jgi:hypothetical protein